MIRHDPEVAGHEAAHAVVGILSGLLVCQLTVCLTPAERREYPDCDGLTSYDGRPEGWPIPLTPTADLDTSAAGYAWDRRRGSEITAWRDAAGDRGDPAFWAAGRILGIPRFLLAAGRADAILSRQGVPEVVEAVAARLARLKYGRLNGRQVERMLANRGLISYAPDLGQILLKSEAAA